MKKILLVFLLLFTLVGCDVVTPKDKDYNCEFTYYGETHNFETAIVESYSYSKSSTWVSIYLTNGDHILIDLTQISMLCEEIEDVK